MFSAAACASSGGGSPQAGAMLKVAYKSGETEHYRLHSTTDGTLAANGQQQPVKADVSGDAAWHVTSVDGSGNATVDVTLSNLRMQFQGLPQQVR